MKVSATALATDSKAVLDRVIRSRKPAEIQRRGKTVAELRPRAGVSRDELARVLKEIHWTESESRHMKKAMDSAATVLGYAGGG